MLGMRGEVECGRRGIVVMLGTREDLVCLEDR